MDYRSIKLVARQSINIKGRTSMKGADTAAKIISIGISSALIIASISLLILVWQYESPTFM